jgi:hypothetical protein
MAQSQIPDPMARRHLIEKDSDAAQSVAVAEAYLAEGRAAEALVFLVKAEASDQLTALADQAVAEGDAFLLKQHAEATGSEPGRERWLALAAAAEAAGKELYAEMARRHARSSGE